MPLPSISPRVGQSQAAADLLARAGQKLWQREHAAVQHDEGLEAKNERVQLVLRSAMEIVAADNSDESMAELERAIEAAQVVGVLPQLRVEARKLLADSQSQRKRRHHVIGKLARLIRQAESAHEAHMQSMGRDYDQTSPKHVSIQAAAKRKVEMMFQQLRQAVDDAKRQNLSDDILIQASDLVKTIEKDQCSADAAEFKLKQLMTLKDPEKIEARLQLAKKRDEIQGPRAQKVLGALQARVAKLQQHDHHQQWLDAEIEVACEARDALRLRQLVCQGRILELKVSPGANVLLHELEALEFESPSHVGKTHPQVIEMSTESLEAEAEPRTRHRVAERLNALLDRKKAVVEKVLRYVAEDPALSKFDEARQAISDMKATKVPIEIVMDFEKQLVALEAAHEPRLRAEEQLLEILRNSDLVSFDGLEGENEGPVLQDLSQIAVLRKAVAEGRNVHVVNDLLNAGVALLERTVEFEAQQREAAELLRNMLKNPIKGDRGLEELHSAIDQASRCGLPTLQAECELLKLREAQVLREAAEAELREARKGQGEQGKARLEAAIQAAKNVGVNAQKLHAASHRMKELEEHQQKCSWVAGNLRRRLPTLEQEPWRFQQIMESAEWLQPWTPELDTLVRAATEKLEKNIKLQMQQKEVQATLKALLKKIAAGRHQGQTCGEDAVQLAQVLQQAKAAKVREDFLQEGEQQLKELKREGCQRTVAEHRLRLALNAKDFGEIERSVRKVRGLGDMLIDQNSNVGAKSEQYQPPQSARLMDSANAMLRHLGDMATRRQAAETQLLQHIGDGDGDSLSYVAGVVDSQAGSTVAQQGSDAWVKEVMDIVHEAKQCGVAPSLIEHAKLKIRQKRRERGEEAQAVEALQKSLAKKDVSTQELLWSMRKVERFQAGRTNPSRQKDSSRRPKGNLSER